MGGEGEVVSYYFLCGGWRVVIFSGLLWGQFFLGGGGGGKAVTFFFFGDGEVG